MVTPLFGVVAVTAIIAFILLNKIYRSLKIDKHYGDLYIFITGCDTGFGNVTARKLDSMGFHVFAACLTPEKVEEFSTLCSKRLIALQLDITDESAVQEAANLVKHHLPSGQGIWALINNAGIMGPTIPIEWLKKSHYQAILDVNFLGMVSVTKTLLPLIREGKGRIVNTASVLGRFASPPASYSISKFCIEAYTDCLRREMAEFGVSVHTIEPGGYKTSITDGEMHVKSVNKAYNELDSKTRDFFGEKFKDSLCSQIKLASCLLAAKNLQEVADTYIHAITARHPKTRYVVGLNGNFVFRSLWTLPTWLSDFCVGMGVPQPAGL